MPIYQYNCQSCGHQLEVLQKITEEPLSDCPKCGASALKKGVTAAAFRLKGTGWYETDFKNKQAQKDKPKDDKKTAKTESGGDPAGNAKKTGGAKDEGAERKKSSGTAASDA